MKLHFNVTKATWERALEDLTVGERVMLFDGESSALSERTFLARFLCREDLTPIEAPAARRTLNGLSRDEFEEAKNELGRLINNMLIPPESASASSQ